MNLKKYKLEISYLKDNKVFTTYKSNDVLSINEEINENTLKLNISSKEEIQILKAELTYVKFFSKNERFFGNGYQSWTLSKEYKYNDRQRGLMFPSNIIPIAKKFAKTTGDYDFVEYRKRLFHSHTYTYFRIDDNLELVGSINEYTGYTIFYMDQKNNVFKITKDVEGLIVNGEYELFNLVKFFGKYNQVFDNYFNLYMEKKNKDFNHLIGYTSWYNYFNKINEQIILDDLEALYSKVGSTANCFQIDDGYQTKTGDWLSIDNTKFPNGIKFLVEKIHSKGYSAGLWLSPFAAEYNSDVVKNHPEWLIKDKKGRNVLGGLAWGGFYAIDIENEDVKNYLKHVFDVVLNDWGFDIVKLDFLYCSALKPRNGKTRGQIMNESIDFLRECCGDKIILACGVPLSSTWGKVDICRIGPDVDLSFRNRFYSHITNQEIVSTKKAITNSIFRHHLNKRVFSNDTDVFFLRNDGKKTVKFNLEQKKLLALINNLFSNVLFVSDNVNNYDNNSLNILKETFNIFNGEIISVEYVNKNIILIKYKEENTFKELIINIKKGKYNINEINN